ncbi:alpha/beta fold hydrolase [Candidatus Protofrankia californiensis]|uniref:alpha/beta fold hydrolase n=1 Tax=Candidatus Protofrankia californiensis TaxID=1839754 RepID=UPI0010414304|nr:alpha/beta hydrolase [Candidatus Protofrankia californiensis]
MVSTSTELPSGVQRSTCAGLAVLRAGSSVDPPVVLLPGYTGSKEDFLLIIPRLAQAGFDVIAVDQHGQYESPATNPEWECTVEALAGHVGRVVDEIGRPVHLLGHSFGGLVARAAVIARPSGVASLVLLSSGPAGIVGPRRIALRAMRVVYNRSGRDAVWAAVRVADTAVYPPAGLEFLERRFFASSDVGLRVMGEQLLDEPDRVSELAATVGDADVPVLVAHGIADDAWPPRLQAEMAARLDARYEVIAGAAHSPATENPKATAAVLVEFWRNGVGQQAA